MANPQKENGYTPIANEILNQLVRVPLNGTQWRILLFLWRETYGCSRKECAFSDTFIASSLGIRRQNAHSEFKALEDAGIIITAIPPTFSNPRVVSFGKDYDLWNCKPKALQACDCIAGMQKDSMTGMRAHAATGMQSHASTGMQSHAYRKQPIKQPIKKVNDFFERIWVLYPRKEGRGAVSQTHKAKLFSIGLDEMTRTIQRYAAKLATEGTPRQYIMKGSTFFNTGYIDYLDANYDAENAAGTNMEGVKW